MAQLPVVVDLTDDEEYFATIPGPPVPKPSPNFYGHVVNKADRATIKVRSQLRELIPQCRHNVIFGRDVPVCVTLWFHTRRPNEDFRSRRRGTGRLKLPLNTFVPVKGDVDNMVKFILDAMTGVVFADDSQVVKITAYKLRDTEGMCEGKTQIYIARFKESRDYLPPTSNNY